MSSENTVVWKPAFKYAEVATKGNLDNLVDEFEKWSKVQGPLPALALKDGWNTITPQIAEDLLRRNLSNRPVNMPTIRYYARQMKGGNWPKTGQPLIFDENGELIDGQHRLWSCLISGTPFITYVVTGVPQCENLFAFIDNGKSRSPADALRTAGFNGQSPAIVQLIDWAIAYDHGKFVGNSTKAYPRVTPVEYLHYVSDAYPNVQEASHHAASTYSTASKLIDRRVVGFVTMKILDIHNDITLAEDFFNGISGAEDVEEDDIRYALRQMMEKENAKLVDSMNPVARLANTIIAFDMWMAGEKVPVAKKGSTKAPKWSYTHDEAFPRFNVPELTAAAAE